MDDPKARAMALIAERGVVSARLMAAEGVPRYVLSRLAAEGLIGRLGRGYYVPAGERDDLGEVRAAAVGERLADRASGMAPVLCLHTAAVIRRLTTDNRVEDVWVAIDRSAKLRLKRGAGLPVFSVKMPPELLVLDVEPVPFGGREVMVTTRERTIVDMLRYTRVRRRDGRPVVEPFEANECLRKGLDDGADIDEIVRIARSIPRCGWIAERMETAAAVRGL